MIRRKVLLLGLDGVRRAEAIEGGYMPHLRRMADTGTLVDTTVEGPTMSGPSWSTILTGSTLAEHGVADNTFLGNRLVHHPDVLSRAYYQDQTCVTFAAADWPPLLDPDGLGPVIFERREQVRAGQHVLIVRDGERYGYRAADEQIAAHAALYLRDLGPDASFVYLCLIDEAGHLTGPLSPEYRDAMRTVDEQVGKLVEVARVRSREAEEWLVVATTDHGHVDAGGHGGDSPEERETFVVAQLLVAGAPASVQPAWPRRIRPVELCDLLLGWLRDRGDQSPAE